MSIQPTTRESSWDSDRPASAHVWQQHRLRNSSWLSDFPIVTPTDRYASNIDKLHTLGPAVQLMAVKHCGLQVLPEHYSIVHDNVCACSSHLSAGCLGDKSATASTTC